MAAGKPDKQTAVGPMAPGQMPTGQMPAGTTSGTPQVLLAHATGLIIRVICCD